MDCSTPGFPVLTNSQSLLKLMSIESVMPSNHLILCHPLLLPSVFPSIRVFTNESVLHIRWPKYAYDLFISLNVKLISIEKRAINKYRQNIYFLQSKALMHYEISALKKAFQAVLVVPAKAGDIRDRFSPWVRKIP